MIVTNCSSTRGFFDVAQHAGSYIRAARMVAEVLGKLFFMAIGGRDARVDRYLRNC